MTYLFIFIFLSMSNCFTMDSWYVPNNLIKKGTIDLSNMPVGLLKEIKVDHPNRITKIDLSHNKLKTISADLFNNFPNLYSINLSHNEIKTIEGTFKILSCLKYFDISYNKLEKIGIDIFIRFTKLRKLSLNHNQISLVSFNNAKWMLRHLVSIDLRSNQISDLPRDFFYEMVNLRYIFLENNFLEKLDLSFKPGNCIIFINSAHNRISTLNSTTFCNLSALKKLFLNSNLLNSFDLEYFTEDNFPDLTHLNISNNNIEFISSDMSRLEEFFYESKKNI